MPNLEIAARNFIGTYTSLNGTTIQPISRFALLRSMITVGYKCEADAIGYGWRSIGWHLSTCFLTIATTVSRNGNLVVSKLFHSLDSSEKNMVSYRLGMGLTKYTAEVKLNVPWLVHLDKIFNAGGLTLQDGTLERGDLAGQDGAGVWHVVEAKGRSNPPSGKLLTKAKNQVSRVTSINGQPPATKSASIIHLYRDPIRAELVDPQKPEKKPLKIQISLGKYFPTYYAILLQLLDLSEIQSHVVGDVPFSLTPFDFGGNVIGIGLADAVRRNPTEAQRLTKEILAMDLRQRENPKKSIGLDGVIVAQM